MSPIVTIRPRSGAGSTVSHGAGLGLDIAHFPLSELRALDWRGPDPTTIDALLIGSANAIRLGGPELARYRGKPAFAVGAATAAWCRRAGFAVAQEGTGGLQHLLSAMPAGPVRLLRVAARDHLPLDFPADKPVELRIAYEQVDCPMPEPLRGLLDGGQVLVLLHSAAAAAHLARECSRLGVDRAKVRLAALGPRIAAAAGEGWGGVRSASEPSERALLALARDMCH